ncbi:hypothetical protein FDUTEX481_08272 [Tolypothrix sp. PCC 7601]|nr:hypothetical protein FDUTEX481_08272 [Tolypothrix sp. PCC 7601]
MRLLDYDNPQLFGPFRQGDKLRFFVKCVYQFRHPPHEKL